MQRTLTSLARTSAATIVLSAGLLAAPVWAQADEAYTEEFNTWLEEQFERELMRSPVGLMQQGRRERYDEWGDFTDQATFEQLEIDREQLDTLHTRFDFDRLTDAGQVSYLLFEESNQQAVEAAAYYRDFYPINPMFNFPLGVTAILVQAHQIANLEEAEAYVTRVGGLERVFGEIADTIDDRTAYGVTPPDWVYPQLSAAIGGLAAMTADEEAAMGHPFYDDFVGKIEAIDLDEATRERLRGELLAAISGPLSRGYARLISSMDAAAEVSTTQDGVWRHPNGEAFYARQVQVHTGQNVTPEEVHEFGLAEVARIHDEMREIMAEVGFEGTLQEFFAYVTESDEFKYPNTEEGREQFMADNQAAQERIEARTADWFNLLPEAQLEIWPVEDYRTATMPGASYSPPPPDGSRPGIFYANLSNMDRFRTFSTEALFYHEGVPGHHFQFALSIEAGEVPTFQRNLFVTSFLEGWGLYSERLAHEMGAYSGPYSEFGRLNLELWRAVRLVVDTGAHYHHWDLEQVIEYMRENTALSEETIQEEARRYLTWPGQALAYKMGMEEIIRLREHARAEMGEDFDIRRFHDIVLGNGVLTMNVLGVLVENYIEEGTAD